MIVEAAGQAEIPALCIHHRKMFQEMWAVKGLDIDENRARALESAYREKLDKALPEGVCRAWVIKTEGQTIASGAMSLVNLVPVPGDLNRLVAYLHSIYTEPSHRHQGCARQIVDQAIHDCRELGIRRVLLNASQAGRRIYEKAGFVTLPDAMRLIIKDDDKG